MKVAFTSLNNLAGIKSRGFNKSKNFARTNVRGLEQKQLKTRKLIPAKICTIKVVKLYL